MNTLIPEILTGIGLAVFIGSLMALMRGRTPSGLVTQHASHRPRAVSPEQAPLAIAADDGDEKADDGDDKTDDGDPENESGGSEDDGGSRDEEDENGEAEAATAFRLHRFRTIFFLVVGFITAAWGIATILTRG